MPRNDPYTPTESYYECVDCGRRGTASHTPGVCPACDGRVRNLAVPRE